NAGDARLALEAAVIEVAGVDADAHPVVDQRVSDLAQRSVSAVDGDNGVATQNDDDVASEPHPGEDRELDVRVRRRVFAPTARHDADRVSAGVASTAAGGLHDAAAPAADERRTALRDFATDSLGAAQRPRSAS